ALEEVVAAGELGFGEVGEEPAEGPVPAASADEEAAAAADLGVEQADGLDEDGEALVGAGSAEEAEAEGAGVFGRPGAAGVVVAAAGSAVDLVEVGLAEAHGARALRVEAHHLVSATEEVAGRDDEGGLI